ncbi:MAG: DsbA family oxidoreductase [Alphaproteobacteria bacterium]|jgi:predicted DsbA family dithiol-disulfide isomerase|nr:DsbA family oxidoreductase [Alphaproteobacteria bacterium]
MPPKIDTAIIDIDIFSDIICPWCYIGKKRLEAAFALRPNVRPRYRWRTFLLNPTMPQQGMDRQAYLHAKFGPAASAVYARISKAGAESGIDFNFMDIERTPDSRPIHKLLIAAGPDADPLSEHFFQAYFLDGLDISDSDIQKDIVAKSGLDMAVLQASDSEAESQLTEDLDEGRMAGIEGVPMMIFSGRYSLAGAYPPDVLVSAIDACVRPASDF